MRPRVESSGAAGAGFSFAKRRALSARAGQQMSAQLPEPRTRQVAIDDGDAEDTPVGRHGGVHGIDAPHAGATRPRLPLHRPGRSSRFNDHQSTEHLAVLEDSHLTHGLGGGREGLLQRNGVDVLSAGQNQDLLDPPRDREVALGVEHSEVPGVEPAVAENGRGLLGPPVVAHHHLRDPALRSRLLPWCAPRTPAALRRRFRRGCDQAAGR